MRKKSLLPILFLSLLGAVLTPYRSIAQGEIVITNPDGLNALWAKIPDNGSVKEGEVDLVGNTQPECAGLALRRFKRNINQLDLNRGIKNVVSTGFSTLGLVIPGGYAKYALLALKMTFKAMTADSPEEFENEVVKETIKQIGSAGITVKSDKLLEKSLKEAFKKIIDVLFKMKKDIFNKPLDLAPCKNGSVVISLDPPPAGSNDMKFTLSFTMDEECDCLYPPAGISGSTQKLKKYSIWGSMPVTVTEIEYQKVKLHLFGRKDKIKLTLEYGNPEIHVNADCGCDNVSNTTGETVMFRSKTEISVGYSYLKGQIGNDLVGFPLGGNASFMYNLNDRFSAGIGYSYHRKKNDLQTYSRSFPLLIGQYYFTDPENEDAKVKIDGHLLAGMGFEKIKFVSGSYSNTSKGNGFAAGAGLGFDFKINTVMGVRLQTDFIGVKYKNNDELNKNLRGVIGLYYQFARPPAPLYPG